VSDANLVPDPAGEPWNTLIRAVPGLALALLGAAVRVLRSAEPFSLKSYLVGVSTAAFAGLVTAYYLDWLNINPQLRIVFVGIAGYMARDVLDFITRMTRKYFRSELARADAVTRDTTPTSRTRRPATNDEDDTDIPSRADRKPVPQSDETDAYRPANALRDDDISITIKAPADAPPEVRNRAAKAVKAAAKAAFGKTDEDSDVAPPVIVDPVKAAPKPADGSTKAKRTRLNTPRPG